MVLRDICNCLNVLSNVHTDGSGTEASDLSHGFLLDRGLGLERIHATVKILQEIPKSTLSAICNLVLILAIIDLQYVLFQNLHESEILSEDSFR